MSIYINLDVIEKVVCLNLNVSWALLLKLSVLITGLPKVVKISFVKTGLLSLPQP